MGIIHKTENEEKLIENLCKNKNINLTHPSFTQVKLIIDNYLSLKGKMNKSKIDTDNNANCLFSSKNNPGITTKRLILRIKKWIKMVHSSQPFIRRQKKLLTYQNITKLFLPHKAMNSPMIVPSNHNLSVPKGNNNSNTISNRQHYHSNNSSRNDISGSNINCITSSSGVSDDSGDNNLLFGYNSDTACYNNTYIEIGLSTFYRKTKSKLIERIIKGPPKGFIIASWVALNKIPIPRPDDVYEFYLHANLNANTQEMILRDINRTFSSREYSQLTINYPDRLYHVLKAFAKIDKQIGYCQGMNFIVAFLLLLTEWNERDTFFLLIALFSDTFQDNSYSLRGFYLEGFPLLLYFNYLFGIAFDEQAPKLSKRFSTLGIPLDVWIGRWFQTLFTVILPIEWCVQLWNCLFVYDNLFMVKFAIVFIQELESDLIELNDEQEVMNYFSNVQQFPLSVDSENLSRKCSIDKLIAKAIKLSLNFNKALYIKEIQPDFETILQEDIKIVYNLSVDSSFILRQLIDFDNDDNNNNGESKGNISLDRIPESNYENYHEDIDENTDENSIPVGIDKMKSISRHSGLIEQNLREHELDFRLLKSELDYSKSSFKKYNSIAISNNNNSHNNNHSNKSTIIDTKISSNSIKDKPMNSSQKNKKYFQTKNFNDSP